MTSRFTAYGIVVFLIVTVSLTATVGAAGLDVPEISKGIAGHAKQTISITAGPSGMPNGFTLWWADGVTYASLGGEWPDAPVPGMGYAVFDGTPTLNTFGGQYTSFKLGPQETILIEIGDLRDESGVSGTDAELQYDRHYFFVAFANNTRGVPASSRSATVSAQTTQSTNCTYTQGFWKNHKDVWPVQSLQLGGVTYTKQELCDILDKSVKGNGLVSLAHQLIAAKLNLANGADDAAVIGKCRRHPARRGVLRFRRRIAGRPKRKKRRRQLKARQGA